MNITAAVPEQKAARGVFEREVMELRAGLRTAGQKQTGLTELVILLLLFDLSEHDRWAVFVSIVDWMEGPRLH
jgi:hypothetical protein